MRTLNSVSEVTTEVVRSVYSGKDGKCCCGCAGKHRYNSAHRVEGSRNRGYEVRDEDVSDREVKRILGLIKTNESIAEVCGEHAYVVLGNRLYILYLVDGVRLPDLEEERAALK